MQQKSELPEGWEFVSFGDILEINPSKPPKNIVSPDTPVTFVPMPAVDAVSGEITDPEVRPFSEVRKGYTAFRNDDVILAKITPCMENGKAAVVRNLLNNLGFGSTEFIVFRSKGAILPDYLYHFIHQESYRKLAESNMTGSVGQKRVPKDFVQNSSIPLPPLPEQYRIVSAIEALFARLDATNEKLDRVPEILKRFRESVLAAAYNGILTEDWRKTNPISLDELLNQSLCMEKRSNYISESNELPMSWILTKVGKITSRVQYGTSVKADADETNGIPILRMGNIQDGKLDFTDLKYISYDNEDIPSFYVQQGDILFNRTNSPELVGKCAVVNIDINAIFASYLIRIRCLSDILLSDYLSWWIMSPYGRKWAQFARTDGVSQSNINASKLKSLLIPLPPFPEQHEIVRRVDALFAFADSIETKVKAAMEKTEKLRQSILTKAFSGELVETEAEIARKEGRDYETAEVLIERIKEERRKSGKKVQV